MVARLEQSSRPAAYQMNRFLHHWSFYVIWIAAFGVAFLLLSGNS